MKAILDLYLQIQLHHSVLRSPKEKVSRKTKKKIYIYIIYYIISHEKENTYLYAGQDVAAQMDPQKFLREASQ